MLEAVLWSLQSELVKSKNALARFRQNIATDELVRNEAALMLMYATLPAWVLLSTLRHAVKAGLIPATYYPVVAEAIFFFASTADILEQIQVLRGTARGIRSGVHDAMRLFLIQPATSDFGPS